MSLSFYNYSFILSHNAFFNFIMGARGLGKTYGAKKRAVRAALKKGEQFIYLRRYKPELKSSAPTFFADLIAQNEFPGWDFQVRGNLALAAPASTRDQKGREWRTIGYFMSLSTAQSQKSVAFPEVKTIIFDEFIIEKGAITYLPNEHIVFQNFYSTVDRWQDKTRVFFLSNSVSIMNPYFLAYDIKPETGVTFFTKAGGYIAVHFPDAAEFSSQVYETAFGKFIKGTEYADYAVGNQFSDNHDQLLEGKSPEARYRFTLESKSGSFSVWFDMFQNRYYVQKKLPKVQTVFTLVPEKMSENKILVTFSDKLLSSLRTGFRMGRVVFDEPTTRNVFAEIFKR